LPNAKKTVKVLESKNLNGVIMKQLITLLASVLLASSAYAEGGAAQPSSLPSILMLVVFVVIFYFLLIRPQMKRNKEQRQLVNAIEKGDEVFTAAGLYGKIVKVEETSVELEVAKGVVVKMQKQSISGLLPKGSVTVSAPEAQAESKPKAVTKAAAKKTTKAKKD